MIWLRLQFMYAIETDFFSLFLHCQKKIRFDSLRCENWTLFTSERVYIVKTHIRMNKITSLHSIQNYANKGKKLHFFLYRNRIRIGSNDSFCQWVFIFFFGVSLYVSRNVIDIKTVESLRLNNAQANIRARINKNLKQYHHRRASYFMLIITGIYTYWTWGNEHYERSEYYSDHRIM